MSNKTNKESIIPFAEEVWDKYSQHIDDDLFSLEQVAGTDIITRSDFMKAALQLSAHCKEKEEEIRQLKLENDRLYLKLDDYERII